MSLLDEILLNWLKEKPSKKKKKIFKYAFIMSGYFSPETMNEKNFPLSFAFMKEKNIPASILNQIFEWELK